MPVVANAKLLRGYDLRLLSAGEMVLALDSQRGTYVRKLPDVRATPMLPSPSPSGLRILRRKSMGSGRPRPILLQRPSLLDPRLTGDPWLVTGAEGSLSLCFG